MARGREIEAENRLISNEKETLIAKEMRLMWKDAIVKLSILLLLLIVEIPAMYLRVSETFLRRLK